MSTFDSAIPMLWHHQLGTVNQLFQAIFVSFSGSLFAWSCGSFRKKLWHLMGSSVSRVPQNTAISGLRENDEVEVSNVLLSTEVVLYLLLSICNLRNQYNCFTDLALITHYFL